MSLRDALALQNAADDSWTSAIADHRQAPPDAGFAGRLRAFSVAAAEQAETMRYLHDEGLQFRGRDRAPHPRQPPAELLGGSGRVGPAELWKRFDGLFRQ